MKRLGLRAIDKLAGRHRRSKLSPGSGSKFVYEETNQGETEQKEMKRNELEENVMHIIPSEIKRPEIHPLSMQLPMEIVELIIDNAPDGPTFVACSLVCKAWLARCRYYIFSRISTASGSTGNLLPILRQFSPSKLASNIVPLPPAGNFVQSLVVTQTAPSILGTSSIHSENAANLLGVIPNVRELHLIGVTEWEMVHFLDPLTRSQKLEDLTLSNVQADTLDAIISRIFLCAPKLLSLRVGGLRFGGQGMYALGLVSFSHALQEDRESNLFESIERLSLAQESPGFPFIEELLGRSLGSSPTAFTSLSALELPLLVPHRGATLLQRAGASLTHLTLDFKGLRAAPENLLFDLSPLRILQQLNLSVVHDTTNQVPKALVKALQEFPYNTIQKLRLDFTFPWFSPDSAEAWGKLDPVLALPHLGRLQRVELGGLYTNIKQVRTDVLPSAYERGILIFSLE